MKTKHVNCNLCNSDDYAVLFEESPFRVVRCRKCGLVYVNPRLPDSEVWKLYCKRYFKSPSAKDYGYTDYFAERENYIKTFRKRSGMIRMEPGSVLDIGCAAGFFLEVMKGKGWKVYGCELSRDAADYARKKSGAEVFVGKFEDYPKKGKFDLITMWDFIEHLPDPRLALKKARGILKDGGRLIIETQNVDSLFARILGSRWEMFKHHEHLYHFSPATLGRLLAEEGFEIVKRTKVNAGRYVSYGFLVERSQRVPIVHMLLPKFKRLMKSSFYVNPLDEMIVVARKAGKRK